MDGENRYADSFNPATGEKIGSALIHTRDQVNQAVGRARPAQAAWAGLSATERVKAVRPIKDHLLENKERIAATIAGDNGKTRLDALVTEVFPSLLATNYYCRHTAPFLAPRRIRGGSMALMNKRSRLHRVPYGVVGIISPWNYPFSIPFAEVVMALLAGNAVILKVASETLQVGMLLEEVLHSADLPPHLFTYVNVPGRIAGDAFLDGGVNKLFFTGSVSVGKYLMKKAADTLTPVSLELGGNDAMLVCDDADLDRAAAGAVWAGFQNAGQSCGGVERIYAHRNIYKPFLERLKEKTLALRVGQDIDFKVDMGCMTTARQVETVQAHVKDAVDKGAVIFARSQVPVNLSSHFLPAMVLTGVDHGMRVMREETFGPVIGVMPVDDMAEAVTLANDSDLGLTGSVWSADRKKARAIATSIQAGTITINDHLMSQGLHETAWGGFKTSGIGRTHGRLGFDEMTEPQTIVDDTLSFLKANLWWHPFDRIQYEGIKGFMACLFAKSLRRRATGLMALMRILPRLFKK